MRALLLAALMLASSMVGCAKEDVGDVVAYIVAHQHRERSVVALGIVGADGAPATDRIESVADAVAHVLLPDGREARAELTGWTMNETQGLLVAPLALARFERFHLNATLVMRDGSRRALHEDITTHEQFSRPWRASVRAEVLPHRPNVTTVSFVLYELHDGALGLRYSSDGRGSTADIVTRGATIDANWTLTLSLANGTLVDVELAPHASGDSLSIVVPYADVKRVEMRYALTLRDGTRLTQDDVDGDVYPPQEAFAQDQAQEN